MKIKDLVKECQERPSQKQCKTCPFKVQCDFAKMLYASSCPASYEILLEKEI
jgi:hypothetical protein